jgi:hypothetical protein
MDRRDELIARLAHEAESAPVSAPLVAGRAAAWVALAAIIAGAAMLWREPFGTRALELLRESTLGMLQIVVGLLLVATAALAGFRSAIPSPEPGLRAATPALLIGLSWLALFAYGAAGDATVIGSPGIKRAACWLDVLLFGLPGIVLGFAFVRRLWPLRGAWSGGLLGLAAGSITALLMQFGCEPESAHALRYHVLPGAALAILGAVGGAWFLRHR